MGHPVYLCRGAQINVSEAVVSREENGTALETCAAAGPKQSGGEKHSNHLEISASRYNSLHFPETEKKTQRSLY